MKLNRRRFIAISAAAIAVPGTVLADAPVLRWHGTAMGASASLTVSGLDADAFRTICDAASGEIARLENIFSLYRPESALSRLNAAGRLESPPFDLVQLLSLAGSVHHATNGAFDPTVQPLWHALATGADAAPARQLIGWDNVRVETGGINFGRPGMAITLNGIAQGYATDRVAALLRSAGLTNVLVSVGEIVASGRKSPEQPWRVGISEREDGAPEESVLLEDMAIATSAPSGMMIGNHQGHIINPASGLSAGLWRRISVINASAAIADGLSTAFCSMTGPQITAALSRFAGSRVIGAASGGDRLELES